MEPRTLRRLLWHLQTEGWAWWLVAMILCAIIDKLNMDLDEEITGP